MPGVRNPKGWDPTELIEVDFVGTNLKEPWKYVLSNPASYSPEIFAKVSIDLIFHPERNSKNIRRADILYDGNSDSAEWVMRHDEAKVERMRCIRVIRRRLMPRNPNLDPELEQTCCLYAREGETLPTLVMYFSLFDGEKVPYYVPEVRGIAFELRDGNIYIAYLPCFGRSTIDDRLQRVALNLLRTVHRHW